MPTSAHVKEDGGECQDDHCGINPDIFQPATSLTVHKPVRVILPGFPNYVPRKEGRPQKNNFRDGQTGCVNFGDFHSGPRQSL